MAKQTKTNKEVLNDRKRNKGVHSKNKNSWNPNSKNYKKAYRGQGK